MPQYRVCLTDEGITRQPVCAICHEVILENPKKVLKTYNFGEGEAPQVDAEYVHEDCLNKCASKAKV